MSEQSKLTIFPAVEPLGRYDFASGGALRLRVADLIRWRPFRFRRLMASDKQAVPIR